MITKRESRADYYDEGYSHGYVDGYKKAELDYAEEMRKILHDLKKKFEEYRDKWKYADVGLYDTYDECAKAIDEELEKME